MTRHAAHELASAFLPLVARRLSNFDSDYEAQNPKQFMLEPEAQHAICLAVRIGLISRYLWTADETVQVDIWVPDEESYDLALRNIDKDCAEEKAGLEPAGR